MFKYFHSTSLLIFLFLCLYFILFFSMFPILFDLSLIFTTNLPISVDLFLNKARPRHLYGNHCAGCVDLQRAWKLFKQHRLYRETAMERQTLTSTKTVSDIEEVKYRAPCYNYIGWLQYVGAHLTWLESHTAFI